MKYMKLGTRPDFFYTEDAIRTVMSDVPSDVTIRINNITYLLHKLLLLQKCGLLRRLCSGNNNSEESGNLTLELHDLPGGESAFELCAKFCYGITIILSAHNFVSAFCAAKFLRMTDTVDHEDNFIPKLEIFFSSCILRGWKDSIATLQSTVKIPEWSENLGIIRRCIDSIVEKILKPPEKVTWSFTYTRLGYEDKRHKSVPKDWWTEDVSDLDIDLFQCIITAVRSAGMLPPQLIGEALHVYACRQLPDVTSTSRAEGSSFGEKNQQKKILETIVSLIPVDGLPVSTGFLLRLLRLANFLGVSAGTKAELIRRSGQQLEAAKLNELLIPSYSSDHDHQHHRSSYDIDLVRALLESFLRLWRRQLKERQSIRSIINVGKLIDSYLQVVAMDANTTVQQLMSLAAAVPEIARPEHDELYKAINMYLQEHSDLTKKDKKELCRILDCQKLSLEIRTEVVRNEHLPLRTVVQVLFFNLERSNQPKDDQKLHSDIEGQQMQKQLSSSIADDLISNSRIGSTKQPSKANEAIRSNTTARTAQGIHVREKMSKPDDQTLRMEPVATLSLQASERVLSGKGKEISEKEELMR